MRARDIEIWALNVIKRVELKQPHEDSLVELKREWIPPSKAARRIAGHANAAHGEPILWLIGVDEKQGVQGATIQDLADWWRQVQLEFNGVTPEMKDVNISWNGHTVVALQFETERAPFVVRNPAHGKAAGESIELEVPWREGTRTRSANRNDLILLLSQLQRIPKYDLLEGKLILFAGKYADDDRTYHTWRLNLTLYMYPKNDAQIVIPHHLCRASFEVAGHIEDTYFHNVTLPVYGNSWTGETNGSGGIINGPSHLYVEAQADLPLAEISDPGDARIKVALRPAYADRSIVIDEVLHLASPGGGELFRWARNNYSTGERGVAIKMK